MSLLFSQMSPPAEIAAWLGCAAFVVLLFNQLMKAKNNLLGTHEVHDISPQPVQVQMTEGLVTKIEHTQLYSRVSRVEAELKELRDERKADVGELHEKINDVKDITVEVRTATTMLNQSLQSLSAKLDRCQEYRTKAGQCIPRQS